MFFLRWDENILYFIRVKLQGGTVRVKTVVFDCVGRITVDKLDKTFGHHRRSSCSRTSELTITNRLCVGSIAHVAYRIIAPTWIPDLYSCIARPYLTFILNRSYMALPPPPHLLPHAPFRQLLTRVFHSGRCVVSNADGSNISLLSFFRFSNFFPKVYFC